MQLEELQSLLFMASGPDSRSMETTCGMPLLNNPDAMAGIILAFFAPCENLKIYNGLIVEGYRGRDKT